MNLLNTLRRYIRSEYPASLYRFAYHDLDLNDLLEDLGPRFGKMMQDEDSPLDRMAILVFSDLADYDRGGITMGEFREDIRKELEHEADV